MMTLTAGVPIQNILFTVFQSIFQVFLLCLAGFMLAFKGIVDKSTSKALNHINIALFTPALLFSKVAYFLSPAKLRQLWVIPIFFVVLTGLSAIVAHWLARAFRLRRSQVNFATAAAMFMNSNSLPVALMQSLATTVPLLKWGPDDTIDAMFGRSLTYLVVFSTLGMILRWSYGIRLLSQADRPDSPGIPTPPTYRDSDDTHDHPALVHIAVNSLATAPLIDYETEPDDRGVLHTRPLRSRLPHPYLPPARRHTYPYRLHSHLPAVPTSLGDQSESEDTDELETTEGESEDTIALPCEPIDTGFSTDAEDTAPAPHPSSPTTAPARHATPRWSRHDRSLLVRIFTTLTSLSPPLVASLLALFCVLAPPVQRLLNSTEMIPLKGALDNAGACSVPLTLIVLGGWFWDEEPKANGKSGHDEDVKGVSDGRGIAKSKGKAVEKRHSHTNSTIPAPADGRANPSHVSGPEDTALRRKRHVTSYSRDSSAGSLSSMIGAFGDVLMAHIHPRSARRAKRRRGTILANQGDVEPGLLDTHTETEHENAENGLGRASQSRSRSWADPTVQLSPVAASPTSPTRGKNPPGETLTIIITLLARMVIVPLVVTPMMVLITRLGWGGEVFEDPVFIVSSMLLIASPPALTLAQISQRAKASAGPGAGPSSDADADALSPFERLLSGTVFWAYCVLTPPMTILSVMIGLLLIGA